MGELAMVMSLRGWNKWICSMSVDNRMKHSHNWLSEGKNE